MLITLILFWSAFLILFFCYIGYGMVLYLFNRVSATNTAGQNQSKPVGALPVTIIIPAYNEGDILLQKIRNTFEIDYPADKLEIFVVTDGSSDGSESIVQQYSRIKLLHQPQRMGKTAAIKRAMQQVLSPIVVFSDANAMFNKDCLTRIVAHYDDPATGGVAGEKRVVNPASGTAIGDAEGLYWNYESFMKKQDAAFHTVVGAAGELYSIRTSLFPEIEDKVILDDFVISMKVCLQGYHISYEPEAFATELPSASLEEERKRKVRISAGAYQSIGALPQALNVFKYPALSFQYLSRRLLRWIFCPLMLLILLLTNIFIVIDASIMSVYSFFLVLQIIFYALAFVGWALVLSGKRTMALTIPFYFVFMNYCLVLGCIRFLSGKQTVLWEKSRRKAGE